ncbi:hypothetical protein OLMES_4620 [Oleiphilus messinensis]|uniref:Uncharacterized protein n=2 Tax=Oleiphilus messinensis TaxID=141451 RepID=A0A1Y0IGH1_9GAMM|nr:hypothetical protein OLMES_4620 [Oleiphilus messinensis]
MIRASSCGPSSLQFILLQDGGFFVGELKYFRLVDYRACFFGRLFPHQATQPQKHTSLFNDAIAIYRYLYARSRPDMPLILVGDCLESQMLLQCVLCYWHRRGEMPRNGIILSRWGEVEPRCEAFQSWDVVLQTYLERQGSLDYIEASIATSLNPNHILICTHDDEPNVLYPFVRGRQSIIEDHIKVLRISNEELDKMCSNPATHHTFRPVLSSTDVSSDTWCQTASANDAEPDSDGTVLLD